MAALAYFVTTIRDRFEDKEKGAGVVEYALVIGGISIVLVLGASLLNTGLKEVWTDIAEYIGSLVP